MWVGLDSLKRDQRRVIYTSSPFLLAFWAVIRVKNPIRDLKKKKERKEKQKYHFSSKMPAI